MTSKMGNKPSNSWSTHTRLRLSAGCLCSAQQLVIDTSGLWRPIWTRNVVMSSTAQSPEVQQSRVLYIPHTSSRTTRCHDSEWIRGRQFWGPLNQTPDEHRDHERGAHSLCVVARQFWTAWYGGERAAQQPDLVPAPARCTQNLSWWWPLSSWLRLVTAWVCSKLVADVAGQTALLHRLRYRSHRQLPEFS